jgi:signal transduction histidine kinase
VASLFVIRGNDQGCRFELEEQTISIGRDARNVLQLHDVEISRTHALLRSEGEEGYLLIDQESSNGVFVNGKRVRQRVLENGDQIQLGRSLLLYTQPVVDDDFHSGGHVAISSDDQTDEPSRIIHAVSQEEGSRLFDPTLELQEHSWLAKARSHLQVMYHTTLVVSQTLDIDRLLRRILELIFQWVEADRGCIMLYDPEGNELIPQASRSREGEPEQINISRTILDYVRHRREGVITSDAQRDQRWNAGASIVHMGVREAICVPMQGRYDIVGVIYVDTSTSSPNLGHSPSRETNKFSTDHLKLMIAIAHQAALAVEDTRYYLGMVQAERLAAVGQTVTVLSHHVKNILQGIRGGSYLIEMGLSEHDESLISKGWKIVEKNQNKISDLVLDMLTFSKEREPSLELGNLNEVAADVVELMQGRAADMEVELRWRPDPQLPDFFFDSEQFHRAATNVVTNAIDAVNDLEDRQGSVQVTTSYDSARRVAKYIVDDNGTGIPSDRKEMLFRPFSSQKKGRGTGLGLAVTEKIIKEHSGRVLVENSPTGGARFVLELPCRGVEQAKSSSLETTGWDRGEEASS